MQEVSEDTIQYRSRCTRASRTPAAALRPSWLVNNVTSDVGMTHPGSAHLLCEAGLYKGMLRLKGSLLELIALTPADR